MVKAEAWHCKNTRGGTKNARQGIETVVHTCVPLGRRFVEERRMPVRALRHVLGVFSDGAPSHVGGGTKNARQGIETRCRQLPLRRSHGLWRNEECPSGH